MLAHRRPLRIRHLAIRALDFVIPSPLYAGRGAGKWRCPTKHRTLNREL